MKITEKHTVSVTSILTGEANLGITGWNKKHRTSNKQTNKQTNKNKINKAIESIMEFIAIAKQMSI